MERSRTRTSIIHTPKVVIIGAGNVATHLYRALSPVCEVLQLWSRNVEHARRVVAQSHSTQTISDLNDIVTDADFYIISVPDHAIANVIANMPLVDGIVAHTSGSVGIESLINAKNHGVFYPLQTFSHEKDLKYDEIPFFIEGSDESTTQKLEQLAHLVSQNVFRADSQQRAALHIAAVFACNFANHLWSISTDILANSGYKFDVFKPLLHETLSKAFEMGAKSAQTGPARRCDMNVINAHLSKLDGDNKNLYSLISNMIIAQQHE